MNEKVLSFKNEARDKLFEGVKILADAVTTTLGPKGRNVAITRQWGIPIVVHDGVTVAREVESKDPLIAIGVNLVREAASKTNEEAGDGTTTATLLAYELVKKGLFYINEGYNPMVLRNQIYKILPQIKEELKKLSKEVKDKDDIKKVAYISSSDEKIGALVGEAINKVGKDGLVTVDEGQGLMEHEVEYTEGLEFNRGYLHPIFITNPSRMEAIIKESSIILIRKKISLNNEIMPILEAAVKYSKDLLLIAEDLTGDALASLAANKFKGNINAVGVKAPGVGDNITHNLNDIAILTGGKVLSAESTMDVTRDNTWLGKAEKVIVSRDTTAIIGGKGKKEDINKWIDGLKNQLKEEKSKFEKEKLEERLAKLTTGVAVIKVAGKTEIDMRESVERVKDAIGSATAAREEGIVAGGGSTFLRLAKIIKGETEGERLLKEVLEAPARKLMANSGESADIINVYIKKIIADPTDNLGYEVGSGQCDNLLERGIIDPSKVLRLCLENAISVATSILSTEALIGIKEKNDKS